MTKDKDKRERKEPSNLFEATLKRMLNTPPEPKKDERRKESPTKSRKTDP
jgi:hypothetical protein